MAAADKEETVLSLKEKLLVAETRFADEARKRGFDPAQAQNMAMPATLARLFTECEAIKTELEELENQEGE